MLTYLVLPGLSLENDLSAQANVTGRVKDGKSAVTRWFDICKKINQLLQ